MYNYSKNHYTHGLPSGQFISGTDGDTEVISVLENIHGVIVQDIYTEYTSLNLYHIGWVQLINLHGYNPDTNILDTLTTSSGFTTYLTDMVLVIPTNQFNTYSVINLAHWGTPGTYGYAPSRAATMSVKDSRSHTPIIQSSTDTSAHILIKYEWETGVGDNKKINTGNLTISLTTFDKFASYFHVKYSVNNAIKYWLYKVGTGTYPSLDTVFDNPPQTNGTFFPITYFRYNKISGILDKTLPSYKTTKKLTKFLNIDYDDLTEDLHKEPKIADVEQIMLIMAVPAESSDPLEIRYLYTFFNNLYESGIRSKNLSFFGTDKFTGGLVIQDKRFKMVLTNTGITKKRIVGNIGITNKYAMEVSGTGVDMVFIYKWQISNNIYIEIRVVDLKTVFYIQGQYKDTERIVLIDRSITKKYSIPDKEILYSRSLHIVFNQLVVTEVKFYEQEWFIDLIVLILVVAAVVITIKSFGTAGSTAWAALISAKTALAAWTAIKALALIVFYTLAMNALIGYSIGLIATELAKHLSPEWAIFLAAVAVTASFFMPSGSGITGAPWAAELLMLSAGLVMTANITLQELARIEYEDNALKDIEKTKKDKELEDEKKLLEYNNYLSPFVIFGETPTDYYNRTIHSGNIGVLSLAAISNYVDIALTLPKLQQTLGVNNHVS